MDCQSMTTPRQMMCLLQTLSDVVCRGHRAALAGGTTMHIDFVLPIEGNIAQGLKSYHNKAKKGCMDFAFHVAVTSWNDEVSRDMKEAVKAGVNSFKFFLAYKVRIIFHLSNCCLKFGLDVHHDNQSVSDTHLHWAASSFSLLSEAVCLRIRLLSNTVSGRFAEMRHNLELQITNCQSPTIWTSS